MLCINWTFLFCSSIKKNGIFYKKKYIDHFFNCLETQRNDTKAPSGGEEPLLLTLQIYSTSTSFSQCWYWGEDVDPPLPHSIKSAIFPLSL